MKDAFSVDEFDTITSVLVENIPRVFGGPKKNGDLWKNLHYDVPVSLIMCKENAWTRSCMMLKLCVPVGHLKGSPHYPQPKVKQELQNATWSIQAL